MVRQHLLRSIAVLLTAGLPSVAFAQPDRSAVLTAADGTSVHLYEYRPARKTRRLPILMFHQGMSDARGELDAIAKRLSGAGYNVFSADLRSGGSTFGINATAAAFEATPRFCEAYPDMEAALAHVRSSSGARPILVGSSYSAALVAQLAAARPADVSGFVSFSPAIGLRGCGAEGSIPALRVPGLAFRSLESKSDPKALAANAVWRKHGLSVVELPFDGHGASLLVASRTKGDVEGVWRRFTKFLSTLEKNGRSRKT